MGCPDASLPAPGPPHPWRNRVRHRRRWLRIAAVYCRDRAGRHVPGARWPTPSSGGRSPGWPATPPGALRITTAAATFVLSALLAWRFGATAELPAYVLLGIFAVPLARIDMVHHLLPNRLVGPLLAAGFALLGVAALAAGAAGDLLRGAAGSVILFVFYLILALTSRNGLGMGDVKLAAPLGLYLGYLGWSQLFYGGALAFVAGGLASAGPGAEKPRKQAARGGLRPLDAGGRPGHHPAPSVTPATAVTSAALVSRRIKTSSRRRVTCMQTEYTIQIGLGDAPFSFQKVEYPDSLLCPLIAVQMLSQRNSSGLAKGICWNFVSYSKLWKRKIQMTGLMVSMLAFVAGVKDKLASEKGATATEYWLLVAFIAFAIIVGVDGSSAPPSTPGSRISAPPSTAGNQPASAPATAIRSQQHRCAASASRGRGTFLSISAASIPGGIQ